MRKSYFSMAALAGMFLLSACSNDNDMTNVTVDEGTTSITLSLDSGGDGLNTRAARPVESSEAYNNVNKVIVRVFNADGTEVAAAKKDLTWTAGPKNPGSPGTTDHEASQTIEFPKTAFEASTEYTIVAYGYNEADFGYTLTATANYAENAWSAALQDGKPVEEMFAGVTASVSTGDNKAFPVGTKVTMKRQIAGMLGYFKNIPVKYPKADGTLAPVQYVKVYASNETKGFTFPSFETTSRVNGTGPTNTKIEILSFDLSKLITAATAATDYTAQVNAATDAKATFTLNEVTTGSEGAPAKVANSVLDGKFLIPFTKTSETTFTIELVGQDGTTVLKTWEVVTNAAVDGVVKGTKVYDVKRNYFYSIGQKLKAGEITTDPDPDKPIDLSKESIVEIIINDAWDVIYDLGIE